jgi:hypothetical protein
MKRAALLALLLAGCQPRTEMMIGIVTDIRAPDILDGVQLNVTRVIDGMVEQQLPPWTITGIPDEPFNLPGSYGVFSGDGSEIKLEIALTGLKGQSPVVTRNAVVSLVNGKTLFLRMGLVIGCMNVHDCAATETCVEGVCRAKLIDSSMLPDYVPELVTELTCNSGTTFINTADGTPMPYSSNASNCPDSLCSEGTCYNPPSDDGGTPFLHDLGVADLAMPDLSVGLDMSTGLRGCTGDKLNTPLVFLGAGDAGTTSPSGLVIDPVSGGLIWTDSATGHVQLSTDACTVNPAILIDPTGARAPVIGAGELYFMAGVLDGVLLTPGQTSPNFTNNAVLSTTFLAADNANLYFIDNYMGSALRTLPFLSTSAPSTVLGAVAPSSDLVAVGGGRFFWFDNGTLFDGGALTGLYSTDIAGTGKVQLVAQSYSPLGLLTDANNVYWADPSGVYFAPLAGGAPQTILGPQYVSGIYGPRIAIDSQFIYVATTRGGSDQVWQAPIMANAPAQLLADGQLMQTALVNPYFVVGPHGVYWIDAMGTIWRAPTGSSITAPVDASAPAG